MSLFVEERLLDEVAYGSQFGHSYKTDIKELRNGFERRNAEWDAPKRRGAVMYDQLKAEHHALVVNAHHACLGSWIGFRYRDWSNYKAEGEVVGYGTGALKTYQLVKVHTFGPLSTTLKIYKPVNGTVQLFADGAPVAATADYTTGLVQVAAAAGAEITWSGEFDIPVRFASDDLDFSVDANTAGGFLLSADVEVVELRRP